MPQAEHIAAPGRRASGRARSVAALVGILALCAAVRIWLIAHTEVIARDGTDYVIMARQWSADPSDVVERYQRHVGYPALIAAVHRGWKALGGAEGLDGWVWSAQIASLLAALGATAALWVFAGKIMDPLSAAISVLLFAVTRKWAAVGADALSEALYVCLEVWALVLAIAALDRLKRKEPAALLAAAGAGLLAGGGYLVRPEGLVASMVAVGLYLGYSIYRRTGWRLSLACCAVTVAATLAAAAPYMAAIGGITKKKQVSDFVMRLDAGRQLEPGRPADAEPPRAVMAGLDASPAGGMASSLPAAGGSLLGAFKAAHWFGDKLVLALHVVLASLVGVVIMTWAALLIFRLNLPAPVRIGPRRAGVFVMAAVLAIMAPPTIGQYFRHGFLSHRYLLLPAALLSAVAGAGLRIVVEWVLIAAGRLGWPRSRGLLTAGVAAAAVVGMGLHALRPLHPGKKHYRQAGQFLAERATPTDVALSQNMWVSFYAEIRGVPIGLVNEPVTARTVKRKAIDHRATYLILSDRYAGGRAREAVDSSLAEFLTPPAFVEEKAFIQEGKSNPDTVRIYRVNLPALTDATGEGS